MTTHPTHRIRTDERHAMPTTPAPDCHADHAPYAHGEPMPTRTVANILDTHSVATLVASDGSLLAWEAATRRTVKGVEDASEWVPAPTTSCTLAAWLGY